MTTFVITGRNGAPFVTYGDSGAFALRATSSFVGLLVGGPLGQSREDRAYVTPIAELWADIKARTGYDRHSSRGPAGLAEEL